MLHDLVKKVEELGERARRYKDTLSKNEMLTRYVLIDPFLRMWGWDTENPEQVRPEFATQAGRPDYALLGPDGKVVAFVGAKSLGRKEDLEQYITYCVQVGVQYFIATDGVKWEVYDTHVLKPLSDKKIAEWDILQENLGDVIRKAFILFSHMPFSGIAPEPITTMKTAPKPSVEKVGETLQTLDKITPKLGERLRYSQIVFPDGSRFMLKAWSDILYHTVKWLIETNKLTRRNCPIKTGPKRYLIHVEPKHPSGAVFRNPKEINGLYLEANFDIKNLIKHTKTLLQQVGIDPSQVYLTAA